MDRCYQEFDLRDRMTGLSAGTTEANVAVGATNTPRLMTQMSLCRNWPCCRRTSALAGLFVKSGLSAVSDQAVIQCWESAVVGQLCPHVFTNPQNLAYSLLTAQKGKAPSGQDEAYKYLIYYALLVAGVGFEPTTFRL